MMLSLTENIAPNSKMIYIYNKCVMIAKKVKMQIDEINTS